MTNDRRTKVEVLLIQWMSERVRYDSDAGSDVPKNARVLPV